MSLPTQFTNEGFSPGRTTTVTVDVPDYSLTQDPWWRTFRDLEITGGTTKPLTKDTVVNGSTVKAGTSNVHFLHGIGWQLETMHDGAQLVHEENATDSVLHDIASALGSFVKAPLKAVPILTGVPQGAQVGGDNFNQKQVTAEDDWSSDLYSLIADALGFPPPIEDEIVPLDRVYVDKKYGPMRPDSTLWIRFIVPQHTGAASIGIILRVYFTSLSSSPKDQDEGNGQYVLSLRADGKAFLWEQSIKGGWVLRRGNFLWSPRHQVAGQVHIIGIRSDAYLGDDGNWHGSVINIECQATQSSIQSLAVVAGGVAIGGDTTQYHVPQTKAQNVTPAPVRMDVRRDVRLRASLSFTKFKLIGALPTQVFTNPSTMGAVGAADNPIVLTLTGNVPDGTSLVITLWGADGVQCTPRTGTGLNGSSLTQTWASFNRAIKADGTSQQEYYAVIFFYASSDLINRTPIVQRLDVVRNGAVSLGASVPFTLPAGSVTDYSLMGPGPDPTIETGSVGLISLQDGFTVAKQGVVDPMAALKTRSGHSWLIELNVPACIVNGITATTSTLGIYKTSTIRRKRFGVRRRSPLMQPGATDDAYPSRTWWQGKAILDGLWKRLMQTKTANCLSFIQDPTTGKNYTITKIVKLLLSNGGLPPEMIDVPDLPITLQADANDKAEPFVFEVFSEAFKNALMLVRDYLGAAIVIDANATNGGDPSNKHGCIRLKLPPRPDFKAIPTYGYPILAKFVEDAVWTDPAVIKSKLNLNSYPKIDRGDGTMIPQIPVFGRTLEDKDEPPEGNAVYVSGTVLYQNGGSLNAGTDTTNLWAVIHNWPAANFYDNQPTGHAGDARNIPPDPTHQDYTDGSPNWIVDLNPDLNSQGAVNMRARRIFDLACHRRVTRTLEAPAALTLHGCDSVNPTTAPDLLQIRPRRFNWGDAVLYDEGDGVVKVWYISNVIVGANGVDGGSRNGSAVYEIFRIPELQEIDDTKDTVYHEFSLYGPIAAQAI